MCRCSPRTISSALCDIDQRACRPILWMQHLCVAFVSPDELSENVSSASVSYKTCVPHRLVHVSANTGPGAPGSSRNISNNSAAGCTWECQCVSGLAHGGWQGSCSERGSMDQFGGAEPHRSAQCSRASCCHQCGCAQTCTERWMTFHITFLTKFCVAQVAPNLLCCLRVRN